MDSIQAIGCVMQQIGRVIDFSFMLLERLHELNGLYELLMHLVEG